MMRKSGFSLYELMVAVAVLSLGLVMIYESFFVIADVSTVVPDYLRAQCLIDEMIWEMQDALEINEYLPQGEAGGVITAGRKNFYWKKETWAVAGTEDLYRVYITFSWKFGPRLTRDMRTAYLRR